MEALNSVEMAMIELTILSGTGHRQLNKIPDELNRLQLIIKSTIQLGLEGQIK
jgi:hypothetical protein